MIAPETTELHPDLVHPILSRRLLADGLPIVLDTKGSRGSHLVDALTGDTFVDFFTFYASSPLGMNHPKMVENQDFRDRLLNAAFNKVANSDVYTEHMARFVQTFERVGIPRNMKHAFFISGGALAVENALKVAFDWKVRKNFRKGYRVEKGHQVLHFEQAFHGRSGYTLSLTNTDPVKVAHFPKFDWPRVVNPKANAPLTDENLEQIRRRETLALEQARIHFHERKDDIAAIIIEPIQGEGGDNHFRPEFLRALRHLADENDALLVFDEVQTGVGLTGSFWAYQGLGVEPDIIAFGKKTQVCGILANERVDEVDDNVFQKSSRINSTWGGNIVDMVRFDRILEIIEEDGLVDHAAAAGKYLLKRLRDLDEQSASITNPRGRGLMCAFDLPCSGFRNAVKKTCFQQGLILLGCGTRTVRFRPSLCITEETIEEGVRILADAVASIERQGPPPHHARS